MKFSRRWLLSIAAAATALVSVTSCSPPAGTEGGGQGSGGSGGGDTKSVTVWLQQKPDAMSPFMGASYGNASVLNVTQDRLAFVDSDGKIVPRLMKDWELSSDATKMTINLVDQKFSDGTPFTADDVIFTFNAQTNPAVKSPGQALFKAVEGYQDVVDGKSKELSGLKKVDDHTVEITLSGPDSGFPYQLLGADLYIVSKKALENEDPATLGTSQLWTKPGGVPGLGPYTMSANVEGQRIEFDRNDNYRTPPKFEKLIESFVTQDVATQQLSSGEIDFTLVAPTDVQTVQGMNGVKTVEAMSSGFDRYSIAESKSQFKDARVRQGLLTAIDRAGIVSSVYAGQAEPINTSFTSAKIDTSGFDTYSYDKDKAKQLLTDGGWDFSKELQIWQASGNPQREAINQVVAKNLQDVGVKAVIHPVDQAQVNDMLTGVKYDLFLYGGGNYVTDPSANQQMLSCATAYPKGANLPGYCNKKVDEFFTKAQKLSEDGERVPLYQQAAELENADVSHLWIARPKRVYAYSSKITGGVEAGEGVANALNYIEQWQTA